MKIAKINSLKNVGILDEMTYKKEFTLYKTEILSLCKRRNYSRYKKKKNYFKRRGRLYL